MPAIFSADSPMTSPVERSATLGILGSARVGGKQSAEHAEEAADTGRLAHGERRNRSHELLGHGQRGVGGRVGPSCNDDVRSPRPILATASVMACSPLAQARVTVLASTLVGMPRSITISRATLGARLGRSTPPQITLSTSWVSRPVRASNPPTASTPSAMVSRLRYSENAFTKGVRLPATITARRAVLLS